MMNEAMLEKQEVLEQLRQVCRDISQDADWDAMQGNDRLAEDLGFDSLTMLLLAIRIEDEFGVSIPNTVTFRTVGDVCAYIESNRAG